LFSYLIPGLYSHCGIFVYGLYARTSLWKGWWGRGGALVVFFGIFVNRIFGAEVWQDIG
jgi:hypothetical protein